MIFIFPTEVESAPFRTANPSAKVVVCGVGMAETAAAIVRIATTYPEERTVILAGIAGAYDIDKNPINQVVEVTREQIEELPQQFAKHYDIAPRWGLPQAHSNTVNRSGALNASAQIENMEGAAAAAVCKALGIDFHEIRAISNRVSDPFSLWSIDSAIEALTCELSKIYSA